MAGGRPKTTVLPIEAILRVEADIGESTGTDPVVSYAVDLIAIVARARQVDAFHGAIALLHARIRVLEDQVRSYGGNVNGLMLTVNEPSEAAAYDPDETHR